MSFVKQYLAKVVIAVALVAAASAPAAAQELKIGVVNVNVLLERAPQTRAMSETLRNEFAPRERELAAKAREFEEQSERFQKDAAVMGETERRNAERELRDLQREVARLQNEYQEDRNLRQNEEIGILQRTLNQEVTAFAQAENYDLVLANYVYAGEAVDITEDVLRAIETKFTATSAR